MCFEQQQKNGSADVNQLTQLVKNVATAEAQQALMTDITQFKARTETKVRVLEEMVESGVRQKSMVCWSRLKLRRPKPKLQKFKQKLQRPSRQ